MKVEVQNYAKTCKHCAATLAQGHRKAHIHQRPKEEKPFALIEVDLKGPLPRTKEGFDNIVVIADPCTKYAGCIQFEDKLAKLFVRHSWVGYQDMIYQTKCTLTMDLAS
jgi:hypothetical protein